jgi:hypothetical protein
MSLGLVFKQYEYLSWTVHEISVSIAYMLNTEELYKLKSIHHNDPEPTSRDKFRSGLALNPSTATEYSTNALYKNRFIKIC